MRSSRTKDLEWEVLPFCDESAKQDTATQLVIKRRALRADVQHMYPPIQIGSLGNPARSFRVKTVAELGAAFFHEGADLSVEIQKEQMCWIRVGEVKIPVQCKVRYLTPQLAGVEFIDPPASTRLALRTHFFFELMTAGLAPRAGALPVASGQATRTLSYGDETSHGVEVSLSGGRLDGFRIALGPIGAEVVWKNGEALRVMMKSGEALEHAYVRRQLVGFLRNLRGLNPRVREAVELVSTKAKIEVEVV